MNSSQLLKTLRLNLGLSQKELAQKLGSSQQTVAMIENGRRGIPKSMVKALWDIYKIPCYSVLTDSSKEKEEENIFNFIQGESNEVLENSEGKTFKVNIIATVKCENKKELLRLVADSFLQDIEMLDLMEAK
jgi:transcriptional regulator with XRE-family HTH domain